MTNLFPVPENEHERLKALINYEILDTLPDEQLDAITQLASFICQTPMALVTLIDSDRQWIKSKYGTDAKESPRNLAFCQHTIMGDDLLEIPDALEDERVNENPAVKGGGNIRFYAGMPLTDPNGYNLGALCVVDKVPRKLSEEQKTALRTLSKQVMASFELHKKNAFLQDEVNKLASEKMQRTEADLETYKFALDQFSEVSISDTKGVIKSVNDKFCNLSQYSKEELTGSKYNILNSGYHPETFFKNLWDTITSGRVWHGEIKNKTKSGELYWAVTTIVPSLDEKGKPLEYIAIQRDITDKKMSQERFQLENRIVSILSENDDQNTTIKRIAEVISTMLHWDVSSYWDFSKAEKISDKPERIVLNFSDKDVSDFVNDTLSLSFTPGKGLIGRVYEVKEPVWVTDVMQNIYFLRKDSAAKSNLHSAFAFPVMFENKVIGVMEFVHFEIKQPDPLILDMFKIIGLQIGNFINRKRTEEDFFSLAKVQQSILNGTEYSIINTNVDGIITTFNSGAEKMLGYKSEEIVGKSTKDIVIHLESEVVKRAEELSEELGYPVTPGIDSFVAKADQGIADTNEWTYIRKDGSHLTALLTVNTIRDEEGEIAGHLGIARDITESLKDRAKIELYDNVVENMTTGLVVWRLEEGKDDSEYDFSLVTVNKAAGSVIAFPDNHIGMRMSVLFPDLFKSPMPALFRDVVLTKKPVQIPEFKSVISQHSYSLTMFPLPDNSVGTLSHNITEMKTVQEELRKSKQLAEQSVVAKDQFLANMSHEIRTPMNAIIGFTELMTQTRLDEEQKDYIHSVKTAGENLLTIINDILDFSKIESGRLSIEEAPFDIRKILNNVYSLLNVRASNKDISFDFYLDENLPQFVIGDAVRLNQVLVNIVGNAIKFTEAGGVTVKAKTIEQVPGHSSILFSVTDTGIGIQEDMKDTVFERFTQANNEIHRKYGGTGLGLSISKSLVGLMGGELVMKSQYGKGTEFSFVLKLNTSEAAEMHKQKRHAVPERMNSKAKILLFEDNTLNQKLASKVLNGFGFEVEVASNGFIGIDILKEKKFDLVLMDLQMPDMDGYQATTAIRNDLQLDIPIIAMTAHSLVGEKEKCLAMGMDDFISKPFKQEDLYSKIRYLLEAAEVKKKHAEIPYSDIINLDYLREFSGGDPDFEKEMITMFLEQVPGDIATLQDAFDKSAYSDISATAHKLRSSVSVIGRNDLSKNLSIIEKEAKNQHVSEDMHLTFNTIKTILSDCYPALQILLKQHYN